MPQDGQRRRCAIRAICVADIHVNSKRLPIYEQLLDDITTLAVHYRCKFVFFLGDLWHEKHGVDSKVLNLCFRAFQNARAQGVVWVLLRGNHEIEVKSKPHETLLSLFSGPAVAINKPAIIRFDGVSIAWMPWYMGGNFRLLCRRVTDRLRTVPGKHILFAHVGLDEGSISASNHYRVPQNVRLRDLFPDFYDLICLGDYHATQQLADNVLYLGCPIPHMFGDAKQQGVWMLEATDTSVRLTDIDLLFTYPEFHTLIIKDEGDLLRVVPNTVDQYKLKIPAHLMPMAVDLAMKPNVTLDIETSPTDDPVTLGRLQGVDKTDYLAVIAHWVKSSGLNKEHESEAIRWFRLAQERTYGK